MFCQKNIPEVFPVVMYAAVKHGSLFLPQCQWKGSAKAISGPNPRLLREREEERTSTSRAIKKSLRRSRSEWKKKRKKYSNKCLKETGMAEQRGETTCVCAFP